VSRVGKYGAYESRDAQAEGPLSLLTREKVRSLRAQAWRHVRRINPKIARKVWAEHRNRH
jgi:hypothetical protein